MGGPILLEEDNNIEGRIEGTNSLADGCCNKCIRQLVALQKREIYNSTTEGERGREKLLRFPGKTLESKLLRQSPAYSHFPS
jgi:hypothetical protein